MAVKTTKGEPKKLSAIRTFAQDLKHAKTKHQSHTLVGAEREPDAVVHHATSSPTPPPTPPPALKTIPTSPPHKKPAVLESHKNSSETQEKINSVTGEIEKRSPKRAPSVLTANSSTVSFDPRDESKINRGTVITDTKQERFTLWAALTESFLSLWEGIKKEYTTSKQPKYTVASAERRKGIIQTATTKTGRDSISDHDRVVSRIRALQSTTTQGTVNDPAHLLEAPDNNPTWITTTEPKNPSPEALVNPTAVATPIVPQIPTSATEEEIIMPILPDITPQPHIQPNTVAPAVTTETAETENIETASRLENNEIVPITPSTPLQPQTIISPVIPKASPTPPTIDEDLVDDSATNTHALVLLQKIETWISPSTLLIIIGTALMIAAVFVSPLLSTSTSTTQESPAITTSVNRVANSQAEIVILSELPNKIETVIATQSTGADSTLEFSLINDLDPQLPYVTLLEEITNVLPQSFYDTITNFVIGVHNQQPFILIDVAESSVTKGVMYQWESTIVRDLSELFPLPSTLTTATDKIISGTDMRILYSSNEPILYYGFIERNILLITTHEATVQYILANLNTGN